MRDLGQKRGSGREGGLESIQPRAFTLIELLVVVSIIAIVAAILFPVFAQAKESAKKTAAISNLKQAAAAMAIYSADHDDQLPHGLIRSASGVWQYNLLAEVPVDWRIADPAIHERHRIYWANAIRTYLKSPRLLEIGDGDKGTFPTPLPGKQPDNIGANFNGILSTYPLAEVEHPSSVPMLWYGVGRVNRAGQDLPVPQLRCSGNGPCRFNPSAYPDDSNGSGNSHATAWFVPAHTASHRVYTNGTVLVRTDTSAKFRRIGIEGGGNIANPLSDPYSSYNSRMRALNYSGCRPPGSAANVPLYWCYFRPDVLL